MSRMRGHEQCQASSSHSDPDLRFVQGSGGALDGVSRARRVAGGGDHDMSVAVAETDVTKGGF